MSETADFIARVLRAERQNHDGFDAQVQAIDNVALHFATALRVGDAHFSKAAFLAACGAIVDDDAHRDVDPIDVALKYYRQHTGPARREDIEAAADPQRNWHTLGELRALQHAGLIERGERA